MCRLVVYSLQNWIMIRYQIRVALLHASRLDVLMAFANLFHGLGAIVVFMEVDMDGTLNVFLATLKFLDLLLSLSVSVYFFSLGINCFVFCKYSLDVWFHCNCTLSTLLEAFHIQVVSSRTHTLKHFIKLSTI